MTSGRAGGRARPWRRAERLRSWAAWSSCVCLLAAAVTARAAEPDARTLLAYERYAADARRAFVDGDGTFQNRAGAGTRLRDGGIVAGPGRGDGILKVPGGLVHHWSGIVFVPGATLDDALALCQTYADYPAVYDTVVAARVLEHQSDPEGDRYEVLLRLEEQAGLVTAVLDMWSDVRYVRSDSWAYSLTESTEIREVRNAGGANERRLPPGEGRGFLWRASLLAKYREGDGGVYLEFETIGLSRGFPPLLGWIIEPIARRIGRRSVEATLREFRNALLERLGRPAA